MASRRRNLQGAAERGLPAYVLEVTETSLGLDLLRDFGCPLGVSGSDRAAPLAGTGRCKQDAELAQGRKRPGCSPFGGRGLRPGCPPGLRSPLSRSASPAATAERVPRAARTSPPRPSSPTARMGRPDSGTWPLRDSMPRAMGRSNEAPVLRRSAGERLTSTRSTGNSNPAFLTAARTLSRDSRTASSGRPVRSKAGRPRRISTSTRTRPPVEACGREGVYLHANLRRETAEKTIRRLQRRNLG